MYRRCNLFYVNRWHWNRYYTINQGTEKRRNTKLKLSTRTMGILVCLGTDILWKFDGVYRRWNVFCVNCWHSNRYYTINQGTEKRRDTKLKLSTPTMGILVCLGTDFLWKFDGVYRRWNVFCVNRWHSNRYYTINQGTEKRRDPNVKIINADRGNPGFYCELTDCGKSTECIALETHFALGGDTQTVITQDKIQQRKVRIAL